jgi:hypothetical protein
MALSNRANPDNTNVQGRFGWDVQPGFYEVQASAPGYICPSLLPAGFQCVGNGVRSAPLTVPPAVVDLSLPLHPLSGGAPQTVSVGGAAGWNLVGGDLSLWPDSVVNWSWNAFTGEWYHPTGSELAGTGAWEDLSRATPEQVTVVPCSGPIGLPVVPHRWNIVGNPCASAGTLPPGTRALLWTGRNYAPSSTIPVGAAAWVMPASSPLTLTP